MKDRIQDGTGVATSVRGFSLASRLASDGEEGERIASRIRPKTTNDGIKDARLTLYRR
jgi:hypothetical protein